MIARIRTVVEVPFDWDIQPPDETGHSESRVEASKYASTTLMFQVMQAIAAQGNILEDLCITEEVRDG
jgi:hypothetical protein